MDIKEIALKAGYSTVPAYWLSDEKPIACSTSNFEKLVSFAEALIAELAKGNEHIGAIQNGKFQWNTDGGPEKWRARKDFSGKLYTFPPTAEQIANETAEACAELADKMNPFPEPSAIGPEIRSGEWRKFVKEM